MKLCIGAIALIFCLLVLLAGLLLWPFHAMTIYSYHADVSEACPNQVVTVYVDYDVTPGVRITSMEVRAGWEAIEVEGYPKRTQIFVTRALIDQPDVYFGEGRHYSETRAPRVTPSKEGVWEPTSSVTVHGWQHGVPVAQQIDGTKEESSTVNVLPEGEC